MISSLISFSKLVFIEQFQIIVFVKFSSTGCVILVIYVDDIIISGSDLSGIEETKRWLQSQLYIKDFGELQHFLGIIVSRDKCGLLSSQHKYEKDQLFETGCINMAADIPIEVSTKLEPYLGDKVVDPRNYRPTVGKLIYMTVTRPDIAFALSIVSQFMQGPRVPHWNSVLRILMYLKSNPNKGLFYRKMGVCLIFNVLLM